MTEANPPSAAPRRFARPQRIAFVQSSFHSQVVASCREAFLASIAPYGVSTSQVDVFEVPGAFEIPLHVQTLAKTRRYAAIVAAGLVIDGELQGFVADTVIAALMDVMLRTETPVFSAVLAPRSAAADPARDFSALFVAKGEDVARACAETLLSFERLRGQVAAGIA